MPGLGPPDGVAMLDETAHCLYRAWSFLARGTGHFWASHYSFGIYGLLKEFRKLHSMSQGRLPVWRNHWKRFILAYKLSGVGIQGIIWKWRKMWARLMESSKKKKKPTAFAGWVQESLKWTKGQWCPPALLSLERLPWPLPIQALPWSQSVQFLPLCPWLSSSCCPPLEPRVNESVTEQVRALHWPLERNIWDSKSPPL